MTDKQKAWDERFLEMAELVSYWSKDPSTKVGAVLVRPDRTVASVGYNGFPRNTSDSDELYSDREEKYARVVHAEVNAILHAREPADGYTLYTYPASIAPTCDSCAGFAIQAGVARVVCLRDEESGFAARWRLRFERALRMYEEAGVEVTLVERRI